MSTVSYADADSQRDPTDLIPAKTLAWAVLAIRPFNLDQGLIETPSKTSEAKYIDCELTILQGPHDKRKLWTRIGVAGSEKYINMGRSAIKAILETGRGASPQQPHLYEIPVHNGLVDYTVLDHLTVGVEVKVEKGKDGYADKNDVALWLSPIDPATAKKFQRLVAGDTSAPAQAASAAPTAPAWTAGTPPAPASASPAAPAQGQMFAPPTAPAAAPAAPAVQARPAAPTAPSWLPQRP